MAILSSLEDWSPSCTSIVVGVVTALVTLRYISSRKIHPSEPTVLPSWIPFVGHLLGMALQGGRYIKQLGTSHPGEPIFTLPVPGSRIYVVTDPTLASAVQRNVKSLSFTPLIPDITKRILGLDSATVSVIRQHLDPGPGEQRGYLAAAHDLIYGSLGPGQYLADISQEACHALCAELRSSTLSNTDQPLDLLSWVRRIVAQATARHLLGPLNPISGNPELENAFWDFDHGLGSLLVGIFPSVTARKAYYGREKVVAALIEYVEAGHDKSASKIVQERFRLERQWNMSTEMMARSALSFLFAGIVNTTTTTYWMLLGLFADEELLQQTRAEIREALEASHEKAGPGSLSMSELRDHCPALQAVFRESLRNGSENFSVRLVKEDVMLADRYFLKKGAVVQISGGVIHANENIWGENLGSYDPRRFLGQSSKAKGAHPAAFRAFGGGKTLCPGRHFAVNQIFALVAMAVLSLDITDADGNRVTVPLKNDRVMPVHILEPRHDDRPQVQLNIREDFEVLAKLSIVA